MSKWHFQDSVASGVVLETDRDCVISGYRIPANQIVGVNIIGIGHDPAYFPQPHSFSPER